MSANRTVTVQIDGKNRGTIEVPADASAAQTADAALADTLIAAHLAGRPVARVVHAAGGELINIVTERVPAN